MPQVLPFIPSRAFYSFETVIDSEVFTFNVRWNGRESAWYFDLLDAAGDVIRAGNKIALGALPGRRSVDPRFPDVIFYPVDTTGDDIEATFDDLGVRVQVLSYSFAEVLALSGLV